MMLIINNIVIILIMQLLKQQYYNNKLFAHFTASTLKGYDTLSISIYIYSFYSS